MADLTPEGFAKLKNELEELKKVRRPEIAQRLKEAIAFGDLSENAAYHEAKEAQGFLEGRILELERIIRSVKLIEKTSGQDRVETGARVIVSLDDEKMEFQIVGSREADPSQNRISGDSPLGSQLMGKRKGDSGKLKLGNREIKYRILEIK